MSTAKGKAHCGITMGEEKYFDMDEGMSCSGGDKSGLHVVCLSGPASPQGSTNLLGALNGIQADGH